MVYGSTSASLGGRTSAAAASKPLPVLRTRKRNARLTSCKSASYKAHNVLGTRIEERDAFQEMFLASRPKFVGMAQAILRNREDAEDAVQNAFLSAYLHLRSFEGRSALTTWFTRVVINAALMIRRKRKSPISLLPDTSVSQDDNWMEHIPASQPDPETVYAESEIIQVINGVIGKMKPALRRALAMTYYDELSGPEACALLGVSAGTFKARLFRAKRQLLNQAQRALDGPTRKRTASASSPKEDAIQALVAQPSNTSLSETAYL